MNRGVGKPSAENTGGGCTAKSLKLRVSETGKLPGGSRLSDMDISPDDGKSNDVTLHWVYPTYQQLSVSPNINQHFVGAPNSQHK